MERVRFVQHKGKNILLEDFSGLAPGKELMETIDVARKTIASQPPKSVLAVMDATNAHYDNEALGALKEFVKANTPHVKASSVVGITGLLGKKVTISLSKHKIPFPKQSFINRTKMWMDILYI